MKIYLVEGLEDPVLLVINIYSYYSIVLLNYLNYSIVPYFRQFRL